jgi:hypothetical protein
MCRGLPPILRLWMSLRQNQQPLFTTLPDLAFETVHEIGKPTGMSVCIVQALGDFSGAFSVDMPAASCVLRRDSHRNLPRNVFDPAASASLALRGRARNRLPRLRRAGLSLRRGSRFEDAERLSASQNQNSTKKTHRAPISAQVGARELLGNLHRLRATVDGISQLRVCDIQLMLIKSLADRIESDSDLEALRKWV